MDSELPEVIKIDDITSGKIEPEVIYQEMDRLKSEINVLRNDMSSFLKTLATIPEGNGQQDYYRSISEKLKTLQFSIKDYCNQYNRLLPIINLAQIKLGHEVEIMPQSLEKPDKKKPIKKSN